MKERPLTIEMSAPKGEYSFCIIFDRDGVMNEKAPPHEYVKTTDEVEMIPDFYKLFQLVADNNTCLAAVFTNQPWLAKEENAEIFIATSHYMNNKVVESCGRGFNLFVCCPHKHEDPDCNCRKPKPGMLLEIMDKYTLAPENCIVIGDTEFDIFAANNAGITNTILIEHDQPFDAYDPLKAFLNHEI